MNAKDFLIHAALARKALDAHIRELEQLARKPGGRIPGELPRPTEISALRCIMLEEDIRRESARLQELEQTFHRVLDAVENDPDRILLKQRYLLGKDVNELAEFYGCTAHTIYVRLNAAASRIRLPKDLHLPRPDLGPAEGTIAAPAAKPFDE